VDERPKRWLVLGLVAVGLLALSHAAQAAGVVMDDAYIAFRYARRLAVGDGLTYNPGEWVEGYTDFLWVVLLAAGDVVGISPPSLAPMAGLACHLAVIALCVRDGFRREHPWAGILAALLVAAHASAAFYAVTGLETAAFTLTWSLGALAAAEDRARAFVVATSLGFLLRPEAALLGIVGTLLLRRTGPPGRIARVVAGFVTLVGPYLALKWVAFGALLPNTALAKPPDVPLGAAWLVREGLPIGVAAVMGAILAGREPSRERRLAVLVGSGIAGATAAGGDWMPGARLLVPYVPCAALVLAGGGRSSAGGRVADLSRAGAAATWLALEAASSSRLALATQGYQELDEARARFAMHLREVYAPRVLATHDIGLLGYLLPEVTIVDLGGLVDREVARAPGGLRAKRPPSAYLESRAPDVFVLAGAPELGVRPPPPRYEVERWVAGLPWFRGRYELREVHEFTPSYAVLVFGVRSASRSEELPVGQ
jgi:hypothetical protein